MRLGGAVSIALFTVLGFTSVPTLARTEPSTRPPLRFGFTANGSNWGIHSANHDLKLTDFDGVRRGGKVDPKVFRKWMRAQFSHVRVGTPYAVQDETRVIFHIAETLTRNDRVLPGIAQSLLKDIDEVMRHRPFIYDALSLDRMIIFPTSALDPEVRIHVRTRAGGGEDFHNHRGPLAFGVREGAVITQEAFEASGPQLPRNNPHAGAIHETHKYLLGPFNERNQRRQTYLGPAQIEILQTNIRAAGSVTNMDPNMIHAVTPHSGSHIEVSVAVLGRPGTKAQYGSLAYSAKPKEEVTSALPEPMTTTRVRQRLEHVASLPRH